jgi:hypothetical protein
MNIEIGECIINPNGAKQGSESAGSKGFSALATEVKTVEVR